jgi:hypothetical protein
MAPTDLSPWVRKQFYQAASVWQGRKANSGISLFPALPVERPNTPATFPWVNRFPRNKPHAHGSEKTTAWTRRLTEPEPDVPLQCNEEYPGQGSADLGETTMSRFLAILASFFLLTLSVRADDGITPDGRPTPGGGFFQRMLSKKPLPTPYDGEWISPDGRPASTLGGVIFARQGNQTVLSTGGAVFPRRVQVTTDPPAITPFALPGMGGAAGQLPVPNGVPGVLRVGLPDPSGLLYLDKELIRSTGSWRRLQSPPLAPGQSYPLQVRAAFKVGDNLLIEDKEVVMRPGVETIVSFDGSRATSVPLPRADADLPMPRLKKD